MRLLFPFSILTRTLFASLDLDILTQDFILSTKRIEIPGLPDAFNPSMVLFEDSILMSFRVIPDPKMKYNSSIGIILLDREFNPIGAPQILDTRLLDSDLPPRDEDARLVYIGRKLYLVYSSNPEKKLSAGGFRMTVGELLCDRGTFLIANPMQITEFEGQNKAVREKNWVPFEYKNALFLSYSISPHIVFMQIPGTNSCTTISVSEGSAIWDWGILRGGTPAILLENGVYLSFFHSCKTITSRQSKETEMKHYFLGAYTFAPDPPFEVLNISPEPLVRPEFYSGATYLPYWEPNRCAFPTGLIVEREAIWISYGRQDHEIWVAKIDKQKLLESLVPTN
jgi:predicted GH43/DUF377 family glycosyl hydrolase